MAMTGNDRSGVEPELGDADASYTSMLSRDEHTHNSTRAGSDAVVERAGSGVTRNRRVAGAGVLGSGVAMVCQLEKGSRSVAFPVYCCSRSCEPAASIFSSIAADVPVWYY